jgi:hypothetical protein
MLPPIEPVPRPKPTPNPKLHSPIDMIQSMQVLNVKEGDTIVIKVDMFLSNEQRELLMSHLKPVTAKHKCGVMILEQGMDIGVIHSEDDYDGEQ